MGITAGAGQLLVSDTTPEQVIVTPGASAAMPFYEQQMTRFRQARLTPVAVPNAETAGPVVMVFDEAMYAGECVAIVTRATERLHGG